MVWEENPHTYIGIGSRALNIGTHSGKTALLNIIEMTLGNAFLSREAELTLEHPHEVDWESWVPRVKQGKVNYPGNHGANYGNKLEPESNLIC